jgi:tRNA-2-methylthio-N6-dimethylallyladenosine synthase
VAAKLYDDDIPDGIKKERLTRVQNLQREITLRKNRERIGAVEEILVEGRAKLHNGQIMGRTRSNRIVNALGPERLVGELLTVHITGATATSLIGEPAGAVAASDIHPEGEFA